MKQLTRYQGTAAATFCRQANRGYAAKRPPPASEEAPLEPPSEAKKILFFTVLCVDLSFHMPLTHGPILLDNEKKLFMIGVQGAGASQLVYLHTYHEHPIGRL